MFGFAGRVLCQLEPCGSTEVHKAVEAAKSAFGRWSRMSGMERARIMTRAAHIVEVLGAPSCMELKTVGVAHDAALVRRAGERR